MRFRTARRRLRTARRRLTGAVPGACLIGPWAALGAPGSVLAGAVLAVAALACYPVAVLFSAAFPGCLVRRRTRARHRRNRRARYELRHPGRQAPRPSSAAPSWLKAVVLFADRRRCAYRRHHVCQGPPQVDHVCPYAGGGLPTVFNFVVLCRLANQVKADYWKDRDGYEHYHPWGGAGDIDLAARILEAELRARRNPLRYARAALAVLLAG